MLWLALFLACKPAQVADCTYDTDCGEDAICAEDGTCIEVECLDSVECDLGEYCNDDYACEEGCAQDTDCDAGELCDDNECASYGCRSTELDCPMGTYCDGGECLNDDRNHCASCDAYLGNPGCGNNAECFIFDAGDSCVNDNDCAPGWSCDDVSTGGFSSERICHRDFCLVSCNPNAELTCPSGMSCVDYGGGNNFCSGDCGYMIENGFL